MAACDVMDQISNKVHKFTAQKQRMLCKVSGRVITVVSYQQHHNHRRRHHHRHHCSCLVGRFVHKILKKRLTLTQQRRKYYSI